MYCFSENISQKSELPKREIFLVAENNWAKIGLATEFCYEKIPRNRLGMVSVIPRKKALSPRHSEFTEESIPRLGMEGNGRKKN